MKIIFDTNFLIDTIKYKIDAIRELRRICDFNFELCILDKTLDELKKINKPESRIALSFLHIFNIIQTSKFKNKKIDDVLVEISSSDTIIATQDQELKRRLRKKYIPIVIIRQRKYYKFA